MVVDDDGDLSAKKQFELHVRRRAFRLMVISERNNSLVSELRWIDRGRAGLVHLTKRPRVVLVAGSTLSGGIHGDCLPRTSSPARSIDAVVKAAIPSRRRRQVGVTLASCRGAGLELFARWGANRSGELARASVEACEAIALTERLAVGICSIFG